MKKNLITIMAAIAILASQAAVFAEATPTPTAEAPVQTEAAIENVENQEDTVLVSENPTAEPEDAEAPVIGESYISITSEVKEVTDIGFTVLAGLEDVENQENIINYTLTEDTVVIDGATGDIKQFEDVKTGDNVTVYTNAYAPAPLVLPTQYQANIIVINSADKSAGFIDVDTYIEADDVLVNAGNTLALDIDETTVVVDTDENEYNGEIAGNDLIVIYENSTKSIPAHTTPSKVVVLGENESALAALTAQATATPEATAAPTEAPAEDVKVDFTTVKNIVVGDKTIENVYVNGESLMVPLREIAETLGMTVEWDGDLRAVILNGGIYSLKIDENSYVKGKMAPVELSAAPEITDDLTYVPVEYFAEITEASLNVNLDEENNAESIVITNEIAE